MTTTLLIISIGLAFLFDVTNGFHDSSNVVAALCATRAATPAQALVVATIGHVAGPLLGGTAVADTVGGVVEVAPGSVLPVVGAAITAAITWNLVTWRFGMPSSSSHALIGGLVGATVLAAGQHDVRWGGIVGWHAVGVVGILVGLAISPLLGALVCSALERLANALLVHARRRVDRVVRRLQWAGALALAFSHGANDAQKTMGVVTLLLVSTGHLGSFAVPIWVRLSAATALTIGTALGGWRIARTVGRGIYRLTPLDGLVSQTGAALVILGAAAVGAPVSTTHVVASGVVGTGAAKRRRHVHWSVVREIAAAWLLTLPLAALAGAAWFLVWRTFP